MKTVFMNNLLTERFNKMRQNYNQKCMKKFLSRKYSHMNSENIRTFYESLNTAVESKLFEIRFHSSFALYLYLYMISRALKYSEQSQVEFTISQPITINFTQVAKLAGISRNTTKVAFYELVKLGIVIYEPAIPLCKNKVKECMIINPKLIIGYNENEHQVIYSIKKDMEN